MSYERNEHRMSSEEQEIRRLRCLIIELEDNHHKREEELGQRICRLEDKIISGFYEDMDEKTPPTYRQGQPQHELEEIVTAEEVQWMACRIVDLQKQLKDLRVLTACLTGSTT